eukprot:INCI12697.2.p1 GENE.INCI12697.2~~INCI12697.2.p1  ORF type:complete len:681 (+),score=120.89 INCI12697.2:109-2151(+)
MADAAAAGPVAEVSTEEYVVPSLDQSLLLCKLIAAVRDVPAERWATAAKDRLSKNGRLNCEDRALSWAFLQEWVRGMRWAMHQDEAAFAKVNSYQMVGDKNLADEWQGDFGRDPSVCLPWCMRSLACPTTLSVVETLQLAFDVTGDSAFVQDASGKPYFGTATQFVSYYWKAPFLALLSAMDSEGASTAEDAFFWVDIFCVAQCKHTPQAVAFNQEDVSAFEQVLSVVSSTWLWCEPWHNPKTLRRVWCLFEALKTLDFGKELQLTMSAAEKDAMQATLVNHFDAIMDTISDMDVSRAEATQERDRDFIFGLIDLRQGGLSKFNADIIKALRGWLLDSVLQRLSTLKKGDVDAGRGGGAESSKDSDTGAGNDRSHISQSSELDEIRTGATRLLDLLGRYSEALPLHQEGIEYATSVFGVDSVEHARRIVGLGRCRQDLNRFTEAEANLKSGLAVLEKELGDDHMEVLSALNNLTHLHNQRSQYEEAVKLARRVVARCGKSNGDRDTVEASEGGVATPPVQTSSDRARRVVRCAALNNLGNALRSTGDLRAARPIYEESCALREELYGDKHPSVALARNNLANLLFLEGFFQEALDTHQRVLTGRVEIFGPGHYYCSTSRKNIGLCLQRLGRFDEAQEAFQAALEARQALFGDLHNKTAEAFSLMGDLRVAQGKDHEALPL